MLLYLLLVVYMLFLYEIIKNILNWEDVEFACFVGIIGLIIIPIISYIMIFKAIPITINNINDISKTDLYYSDIVFLENGTKEETFGGGNFLYWTIDGSGNPVYNITIKTDEGYLKKQVSAVDVYVKESDDGSPKLQYKHKYINIDIPLWISPLDIYIDLSYEPYKIIVPTETVIKKINQI